MTVAFGQAEGGGAVPFVPSEEWIEAFEAQASTELYTRLKRFARARAGLVAYGGRVVDDFYVNELVQDALDDTFGGVLRWEPERGPLELFLIAAIHSRTRHDYAHAVNFPHERLDSGPSSRSTLADTEVALAQRSGDDGSRRGSATERVLDHLKEHALKDPDVLQLLALYGDTITKKADIMRAAGWNSKRYEATRKRMIRLVQQLPNDVRDAAVARA